MRKASIGVIMFVVAATACTGRGGVEGRSAAADTTIPVAGAPQAAPESMDFGPVVRGQAPAHGYAPEQIVRGETLVRFGGCNDCHTPWNRDPQSGAPYPDMERMLSGHPQGAPDPYGTVDARDIGLIGPTFTSFAMPFGITYAMNLTPDIDTGTGSWTEEMFLSIFRNAKHLGGSGRTVLPPMPWPAVATLSDEDIVAIFAYLRSIPPIRNGVPSVKVPLEVIDAIGAGNQMLLEQMRVPAPR